MKTIHPTQQPAKVAVIIPTILRPNLAKSVRSVFTQNFDGRIHLLIGVDVAQGPRDLLDQLAAECPDHVMMTVVDPGYSTSTRHGGMYSNHFGGSLRTVLSFLANAPLAAYLDDNDWWGANHLTALTQAIGDKAWAWSGRWMVHPDQWIICRDEWDSVGPGKGINAERFGGFVQPSGLMMDLTQCTFALPLWSLAAFEDGSGEDRLIFDQLRRTGPGGATGQFTAFCTLATDTLGHDHHRREFEQRKLSWVNDPQEYAILQTLSGDLAHLVEQDKIAEAADTADQILAIHPHHADALAALATHSRQTGQVQQAFDQLARAIEIEDFHPPRLQALADLAVQLGKDDLAERIRSTAQRRFCT